MKTNLKFVIASNFLVYLQNNIQTFFFIFSNYLIQLVTDAIQLKLVERRYLQDNLQKVNCLISSNKQGYQVRTGIVNKTST